ILTGKGKKGMDDLRQVIADMKNQENALLNERSKEVQANARNTKLTILGGTICALIGLSMIGLAIARNISAPLQKITRSADRIAAGDLSVKVLTDDRQDEVGVLARAFARMTQSLQEMAEVAGKIADGDLRVKIRPQSDKDTLGNAFALMVENLHRLTGE